MQSFIFRGFTRFLFISLVIFGGFFYTQGAGAQAQRPDLRIIKATFDGLNLHAEYVNATGVGYPRARYEVGFQWYDGSGSAVGTRHWLSVPEVERGGVAILDNKYRIDLTYRGRDGRNYGRTLAEFLYQRPDKAEELRVMVDDGDRVSETDENNNIARLRIPLPDLQFVNAKFLAPSQLEISYRNINPSPIPMPFRIGFTWAQESGTHLTPTRFMNVLEPAAGTTRTEVLSRTDVSYINDRGQQFGDRLDWYLERRPGNATRLKITIDDAGTVREANEQNNLVSVRPDLPDLVVRETRLTDGQLSLVYGNAGEGYIRDLASRVLFQWRDISGRPVGSPRWSGFAQMDPKQVFKINAERFDVEYAIPNTSRTTTQRLADYVRIQPPGATQLTITIDDEQRILEADENNNTVTVTPPPPPPPDFTIADARLTADALTFTARNIGLGGVPAGQFISFWLEWVNQAGGRVAALVWNDVPAALAPGQFLNFDASRAQFRRERATGGLSDPITFAELMASAPDNATHLKIRVDGPNTYAEGEENNNVVLLPKPLRRQPDLRLEDLRVTSDGAFTLMVRNSGTASTETGISLWLYGATIGGGQVGPVFRVDFPALAVGAGTALGARTAEVQHDGRTISIADVIAQMSDDTTHVKVLADGPNVIAELDESNNMVLFERPRPPRPDFDITGLSLSSSGLALTVSNKGGSYTGPLSVWFHYSDYSGVQQGPLFWADVTFSPKSGWFFSTDFGGKFSSDTGQYSFAEFLKKVPPGAEYIRVIADGPNRIAESNEQNNTAPLAMSATWEADLAIADAIFKDEQLSFIYRNIGRYPANKFSLWFYFANSAGTQIGPRYWLDVDPLAVQGERKFTSAGVTVGSESGSRMFTEVLREPPAGATHFKVMADGPNRVAESDEMNNAAFLELPRREQQLPDFALREVVMTREKITMMLVNNGTADALRPPAWKFIWTDEEGGAIEASPLMTYSVRWPNAGKSVPFELPYRDGREDAVFRFLKKPTPDALALKIVLDPDSTVPEADEQNNTALVKLPAFPDLVVSDLAVRDRTLQISVRNNGTGEAKATDIWLMWFGAKGALPSSAAVDLPALAKGARLTVSVPFDGKTEAAQILREPPTEGKRVSIYLDGGRKVEELNEQNNSADLDRSNLPKTTEAVFFPDVAFTNVIVPQTDNFLAIGFQNAGKAELGPWAWQVRWQDGSGRAVGETYKNTHPGLPAGWRYGVSSDPREEDKTGTPRPLAQFLKQIPAGATRIEITLDPENKVAEADEGNNVRYFEVANFPPSLKPSLPDLAFTMVFVPPGDDELVIGFQNAGTAEVGSWVWQVRWLDEQSNFLGETYRSSTHPGLKPNWRYGTGSDSQDPKGSPRPLPEFLRQMPAGATHLEVIIDPENKIVELDERNNVQRFAVANFPPSLRAIKTPPELAVKLTVRALPSSATSAASSSASAGLVLAFVALLSGAYMVHGHTGTRRGPAGFFAVFPLLFTSSRNSYMFLRQCGPSGCVGAHFNRHAGLKKMARASVVATAFTGVVKAMLAFSLFALTPSAVPALAEMNSVFPGDRLEAALTVKNTGKATAQGVTLTLACPAGSIRDGATVLNGKKNTQDLAQGIPAPDLTPQASHSLTVTCGVQPEAIRLKQLVFSGTVKAMGASAPFVSNTVRYAVEERVKPDLVPEVVVKDLPDLTVSGAGFLPFVDLVEKDRAPMSAIFSGIVENKGQQDSGTFRSRIRLDHGSNGTWDVMSPALVETSSLAAGKNVLVKLPLEWKAPVGTYTFEICVDPGKNIGESNEANNCVTDRFTLKVGEEPAQEEETVE